MRNWQPMSTAPRDGTIIETRCTYGVAPWYGLHYWGTDPEWPDGDPRWLKYGDPMSGIMEDLSFNWRLYDGNPDEYSDPTKGAQETREYWVGAIAALHPTTFGD